MNLSRKQIEAARAGRPVIIETEDAGRLYLVSEDFYRQAMDLLQSEPDQQAFRDFCMRQARRLAAKENDSEVDCEPT